MNPVLPQHALERARAAHLFVHGVIAAVVAILILVPVLFRYLDRRGRLNSDLRRDLWSRYFSWLVLIPLMFVPILLGPIWTILAVGVMSLLCYREFARATGLFRRPLISGMVVLGIGMVTFAVADRWYALFVALTPLTVAAIAAAAVLADQPKGYIQRVAMAILAFLLFGVCYGHLGCFTSDRNYRAILIWIVVSVELNDIFAYIVGKTLGRRKLLPNTSPNKTVAGALGALILTTLLSALMGHLVFARSVLDTPTHLILMGMLMSVPGQLGDLTLSSIKRDLGIKDWAATFPGHGGFLDRFNSLIFVAPAVFHYVTYWRGLA